MSLPKPREKHAPKPGRTQDNFYGHRLTVDWLRGETTCVYCGDVQSAMTMHIAASAPDEETSPVKRCQVAARMGV